VVGEYAWLGLQCQDCGEIVSPGLALVKRGNVEFMQFSEEEEEMVEVEFFDDQDCFMEEESPESCDITISSQGSEMTTPRCPIPLNTVILDAIRRKQISKLTRLASIATTPGLPKRRSVPRPTTLSIPSRDGNHRPKIPSPLRNTWFPRSVSSSKSISPESYESSELSYSQLEEIWEDESSWNGRSEQAGNNSCNTRNGNSGGYPRTAEEGLEVDQEYLGVTEV
jgi:hypothetical protein